MSFLILGTFEARHGDRVIPVTAPKQQAVLATLLLDAGNVVPLDRIVDHIWDGSPPTSWQTTLQAYVYRLRNLLAPMSGVGLHTRAPGYVLESDEEEIDLVVFREHVAAARALVRRDDPRAAADRLRRALAMWRGNALAGIPGQWFQHEARFMESERVTAHEELLGIELALGNDQQVLPELAKLADAHPFRESLAAELLVALYRVGRQAEALQTYSAVRRRLRDELGVEPGRDLRAVHDAILRQVPPRQVISPRWLHPAQELVPFSHDGR
ncbi:AfsR/SARP family transcriptional regulator [Streptomyces sp. DHE7-1]|nr:AfsR/SARP family transcriptional regulator [Streptomyces sp. DHE7-1]